MAFKRIQLRGISRTPSDRMSEDGGCAESLNFQIKESENIPFVAPRDVTDESGVHTSGDILYIHHVEAGDKYILKEGQEIKALINSIYIEKYGIVLNGYIGKDKINAIKSITSLTGLSLGEAKSWFDTMPSEREFEKTEEDIKSIISGLSDIGIEAQYVDRSETQYTENKNAYTIFNLEEEQFTRIISVGNLLGIITDINTHWLLFKSGNYDYLGTKIPFPKFTIDTVEYDGQSVSDVNKAEADKPIKAVAYSFSMSDRYESSISTDSISSDIYQDKYLADEPIGKRWVGDIAKKLKGAIHFNNNLGYFVNQVLVTISLKLIDGSEISSNPILVSPGYEHPYKVSYSFTSHVKRYLDPEAGTYYYIKENGDWVTASFKSLFRINVKIDEDLSYWQNWADIISAVNINMTQRVIYDHFDNYKVKLLDGFAESATSSEDEQGYRFDGEFEYRNIKYSYEEELTALSVFYNIKSYKISKDDNKAIENLRKLQNGITLDMKEDNLDLMSEDILVTQPIMSVSADMKRYSTVFSNAEVLNSKIHALGIRQDINFTMSQLTAWRRLPSEHPDMFPAQLPYLLSMNFIYINNDGAEERVAVCFEDGETVKKLGASYGQIYPLIITPDSNIKKIEFVFRICGTGNYDVITETKYLTVKTRQHPRLDASYWYAGEDVDITSVSGVDSSGSFESGKKNMYLARPKYLYISEVYNPFVFSESNRKRFSSDVIAIGVVSAPVSQGQFGQFQVYVFTKDGIWTMPTDDLGEYGSPTSLSRDVLIGDNVLSIEDGVVFVTPKGVLSLSGRQVTSISGNMLGPQYQIPADILDLLANNRFGKILAESTDSDTFVSFMQSAVPVFDYNGERYIFFRSDKRYAYVFSRANASWHKINLPYGMTFSNALNSYPYAHVVMKQSGGETRILDYSSVLDSGTYYDNSTNTTNGIIITRPIDFDEPDVLKTINHLRIRGSYKRYECQLKFNTSLLVSDIEQILEATGYTHLFTPDDIAKLQRQGTLVKDVRKEDVDGLNAAIVVEGIETLQLIRTEQPRVAYMLLASQDGINYKRIGSLRGKSWKMFRIVILASLKPYERISWIDFEYESRFKNRLR